ncbi:MAG: hypothetical protein GTO18_14210 [Anaerolineales bacterium]|nr:hypothetical protein [Anaerolineales bacterium]
MLFGVISAQMDGMRSNVGSILKRASLTTIIGKSVWLSVGAIIFLGACTVQASKGMELSPQSTPERSTEPASEPTRILENLETASVLTSFTYTYHNPDGNRYVVGRGAIHQSTPLDIELSGTPSWVLGAPFMGGSLWIVVLENGRVEAYHIVDRVAQSIEIVPGLIPPGMPPLLAVQDQHVSLLTASEEDAATLTHPILLANGTMVYIREEGDLVFRMDDVEEHLPLAALPDARLISDGDDGIILLTGKSDRYGHGVLGDKLEATSLTWVSVIPAPEVHLTIDISDPVVIEGIAPIWADLNGDGQREIIVTLSDQDHGARLVAYDGQGNKVASNEPIGSGYRWLHQLAVAPFGPDGEFELVVVRTPHIGGVVEFYQLKDETLRRTASIGGFSSHKLGSRNLDMAVAGDFDGDGNVELLIPEHDLRSIGAIRRIGDDALVSWRLSLEGKLSTNIASASLPGGTLALGVGTEEGVMRLWLP